MKRAIEHAAIYPISPFSRNKEIIAKETLDKVFVMANLKSDAETPIIWIDDIVDATCESFMRETTK